MTVALALASLLVLAAWPAAAFEGFGAATPGGRGGEVYRVTSLADRGPGTLRDGVSRGRRYVVFDVGGTIVAESSIQVTGAFVTIDGSTAPPPGITITNRGLQIRGTAGAHDVVVQHVRVRDAAASESTDCIQVSHGAYNVVLDHVSTAGCGDGNIDVTGDPSGVAPPAHDVTVSWSILAEPRSGKAMLVKYGASRLTLHHNLFLRSVTRNPSVSREGYPPDGDTTLDMRNNVVWDWAGGTGTLVRFGATANVVANLYGNPSGGDHDRAQALVVCGSAPAGGDGSCVGQGAGVEGRAYVAGNVSVDGVAVDAARTEAAPFPAPPVATEDACAAARRVLAGAGAQPADAADRAYLAAVRLPGCAAVDPGPPPPPPPQPEPVPANQPEPPEEVVTPPGGGAPEADRSPDTERLLRELEAQRQLLLQQQKSELKALQQWYQQARQRAKTPAALRAVERDYQQRLAALKTRHSRQLADLAARRASLR